jgi:hypothetical protein
MRFYQCKCGQATSWSSMGQPICRRCSKCGSSLAEGPSSHHEPNPHKIYRGTVSTDEGEVPGVSRCYFCNDTLKEIQERREPFEAWEN